MPAPALATAASCELLKDISESQRIDIINCVINGHDHRILYTYILFLDKNLSLINDLADGSVECGEPRLYTYMYMYIN